MKRSAGKLKVGDKIEWMNSTHRIVGVRDGADRQTVELSLITEGWIETRHGFLDFPRRKMFDVV